ncbi:MAG: UTP--glucose-1-phosphate uridylyltransferase [Deltaproteobacteria bacterium]|nr:MAG: UTP--glucose-1-phosphate uridylyltransferase [Deltaproteobacteria bacterium]
MADRAVRKAVIPAAGLGTRFLPATKAIPKEMLPIVDVPTIQLIVEEAVAAGIEDIVLVNGRGKGAIEDHFDHAFELECVLRERGKTELLHQVERIANLARIHSVRQKRPLGLGHAVACARNAVGDEPFAVLLGDDLIRNEDRPAIGQLVDAFSATGGGILGLQEVPASQTHLYGIVAGEAAGDGLLRVTEFVEKPAPGTAPSRLAVVGRYVFPPDVWEPLSRAQPSVGGEIQLVDGLRELMAAGRLYGVVLAGDRYDAGDRIGYLRANLAYALARPSLRDAVIAMCRAIANSAE